MTLCWRIIHDQHDWTTCDALTLDISQSSWWTREVSGGMQIYSNIQKLNLGTGSSSNLRENESECRWKTIPKKVTSAFCLFLSCWPRSLVSLYLCLCPPQCLELSYLYCLVCHQTLHHRPLVFSPFPRNIANKLPKNAEDNWLKKSQTLPNFSHTSTRPHPTQYWLRQLRSKKTEWSSEVLRASPSSTLCAPTQAQAWKVPNLAAKPHLCRSLTPPSPSSYWLTEPLLTSRIFWREMEEKLFIQPARN